MNTEPTFENLNPQGHGSPMLLVEDNPMDIDLTTQALLEAGVRKPIFLCRDGEEALAYMSSTRTRPEMVPACVLLDLRLPLLSGLEVLQRFRADAQWKRVPVIVLTTSREEQDVDQAYDLGVNSYLVKPVDSETFLMTAKQINLYWNLLNVTAHA